MSTVLGFSYGHNASAAIAIDGKLLVAVQEERLSGLKRHKLAPGDYARCVDYCMESAGLKPSELDRVALVGAQSLAAPFRRDLRKVTVASVGHHEAHAAGAFMTSGFDDASVLVVDAAGDPHLSDPHTYETVSAYRATRRRGLEPIWQIGGRSFVQPIPDVGLPRFLSIGGMYSSVAYATFGSIGDAGKIMGLAPYGTPRWEPEEFFVFAGTAIEFRHGLCQEVSRWSAWPQDRQLWCDLAASTQRALEYAMARLLRRLRTDDDSANLVVAGGVALNGVANEGPVTRAGWDRWWIPPWPDDAGLAVGAALLVSDLPDRATPPRLTRDSIGATYPAREVERALRLAESFAPQEPDADLDAVARLLASGAVVGWFEGRSELGPRALGHRSILMDARDPAGKDRLNREVKHRESFRPFAPVVLADRAQDWFEVAADSPFMLRVVTVLPEARELLPAITHIDGTARIQTVERSVEPRFAGLLESFACLTGTPVLLNTSFNVISEPIVESPTDALWCFAATGINALWLQDRLIVKRRDVDPLAQLMLEVDRAWVVGPPQEPPRWLRMQGQRGPVIVLANPGQGIAVAAPRVCANILTIAHRPITARSAINQLGGGGSAIGAVSLLRRLGAIRLRQ